MLAEHRTEKMCMWHYGTIVGEIKEVSRSYKEAQDGSGCGKDFL